MTSIGYKIEIIISKTRLFSGTGYYVIVVLTELPFRIEIFACLAVVVAELQVNTGIVAEVTEFLSGPNGFASCAIKLQEDPLILHRVLLISGDEDKMF